MTLTSFAKKSLAAASAVAMLASTLAGSAYALPLPASTGLVAGSPVVQIDSTAPNPSPYRGGYWKCWHDAAGVKHCHYHYYKSHM